MAGTLYLGLSPNAAVNLTDERAVEVLKMVRPTEGQSNRRLVMADVALNAFP